MMAVIEGLANGMALMPYEVPIKNIIESVGP